LKVGTDVAGDPMAFVEALHGVGAKPSIELLLDQGVGHRVVVAVDLDVVVDMHTDLLPGGEHVGGGRQRTQCELIDLLEGLAACAGQLLEGAV
jgi:hypothetical protein